MNESNSDDNNVMIMAMIVMLIMIEITKNKIMLKTFYNIYAVNKLSPYFTPT